MKLRYFAKYVNLPFLLEHFYFFYFPEQVGRKDEIVQRLVIRGDYLLFCSLPFLHAFLNKDDIITNNHHGVHVVGMSFQGTALFDKMTAMENVISPFDMFY